MRIQPANSRKFVSSIYSILITIRRTHHEPTHSNTRTYLYPISSGTLHSASLTSPIFPRFPSRFAGLIRLAGFRPFQENRACRSSNLRFPFFIAFFSPPPTFFPSLLFPIVSIPACCVLRAFSGVVLFPGRSRKSLFVVLFLSFLEVFFQYSPW